MEMNFGTTQEIMEQIKAHRTGENHAWIFDDDGNIADGIYTCDVLACLDSIQHCEVEKDGEEFQHVLDCTHDFEDNVYANNTYNWNGNCSEVMQYYVYKTPFEFYVAIAIHIGWDVRVGYTDYVLYKFDCYEDFLDAFQSNYEIENENWRATINCVPFNETNYIWVYVNDELDFGFDVWQFECEEITNMIEEEINKMNVKESEDDEKED